MSRYKKISVSDFFKDILPNSRDNLKQLIIKLTFLLCIIGILYSGIHFVAYYSATISQRKIMENDIKLFESGTVEQGSNLLHKQNNDYRGWISIEGTTLNNPIYKADDNSFYMTKNSLKKNSRYGSICLDYRSSLEDKNAVIYGNTTNDGLMFSTLHNFRQLDFYKNNSVILLTQGNKQVKYKIYAVFVLNSSKEQDGDNIYDIYRTDFANEKSFDSWVDDAKQRSVINTAVEVDVNDKILTLVTSCDDFEGARLVVMAKSQNGSQNITAQTDSPSVNSNPKYPKKWYEVRNITYPF